MKILTSLQNYGHEEGSQGLCHCHSAQSALGTTSHVIVSNLMASPRSDIKTLYEQQGYVIVSGLIQEDDWGELEGACQRVVKLTREGSWPYRRTVGKQFPPYGDENPDSWGVQHIMHPDLHEPAFANWYTSPKLLTAVTTLLGCQPEDLQMGVYIFNFIAMTFNSKCCLRII